MSEQQVPDRLTHVDATSMYLALRTAWVSLLGTQPTRASLLVLLAHWSFETGNGGGMHCYNVGNIKHVPGDGHDFCVFTAGEVLGGKAVTLQMPFRAYASLDEGVADYMHLLRGQYGFAWPAVESGDVQDFAARLKLRGYFTADLAVYQHGIQTRYTMLDASIAPDTLPDVASLARDANELAQSELPVFDGSPEEPEES